MTNLMNYGGKSLVSAEAAKLDVDKQDTSAMSEEDAKALQAWLPEVVDGLKEVRLSSRLVDSPAIIIGHESASMRRMMTMVEAGRAPVLPPQTLEINGGHPIIRSLASAHTASPEVATVVAKQLFANALISAGLLDDPRTMLPNVNSLLEHVLDTSKLGASGPDAASSGDTKPATTEEASVDPAASSAGDTK